MPTTTRARITAHITALLTLSLAAAGLAIVATSAPAQAHGNVNDPIARGYRCLKVWGNQHLNPAMATEDPMCWQAFQKSPAAMWNWNGMLRDGLGSDYKSKIPDGTLCSAGNGDSGRYAPLDVPGNWVATNKSAQFRLNLVDQAAHNADWIDVYISRGGFDPTTQRLGWGDLVLVGHSGQNSGNGIVDPEVGGKAYAVDVNASGHSGRRLLFTVWKASHADQIYFLCSDVNIGGSNQTSTTTSRTTTSSTSTTTTSRTTTTSTTTSRTTTSSTSTTRTSGTTGTGSCTAAYSVVNEWQGGFQGQVTVRAGSSAMSSWRVSWTFPNGQTLQQLWGGKASSSGSSVTVTNEAWNGGLGASQSTTFGFIGSWNGTNGVPSVSCSA